MKRVPPADREMHNRNIDEADDCQKACSTGSGTAPAQLTVSANPAGILAGQILDTTLTLSAVGLPAQVITIPVRLAAGNTFDVGNAPPTARPDLMLRDGFEAGTAQQDAALAGSPDGD